MNLFSPPAYKSAMLSCLFSSCQKSLRYKLDTDKIDSDVTSLTHKIAKRVSRYLEKSGIIERDPENNYYHQDLLDENEIQSYQAHSIQYRIAIGPHKSRKVFKLQTFPAQAEERKNWIGQVEGFSLHAGTLVKPAERDKLERLCRYISRPALYENRLSITEDGMIRYKLKQAHRDGTTHAIFEPLDFIAKLVALVPIPRTNLTRFHGVFAPHSHYRANIIKQKSSEKKTYTESEKRKAMSWAARLKRAFNIDIEVCEICKGKVKIIACIEDHLIIQKIFSSLNRKQNEEEQEVFPLNRLPPVLLQQKKLMNTTYMLITQS